MMGSGRVQITGGIEERALDHGGTRSKGLLEGPVHAGTYDNMWSLAQCPIQYLAIYTAPHRSGGLHPSARKGPR
jgi:hypothetical protein